MAIIGLLVREMRIRRQSYHDIRWAFTTRILIGLEFFVAADLLKTVLEPTFEDLIILGSLVAIRTVVSYFLGKEVSGLPEDPDGVRVIEEEIASLVIVQGCAWIGGASRPGFPIIESSTERSPGNKSGGFGGICGCE
ncbi:MAG: DUF1622 domain-containing protein [Candidatus Methanoculleus thermohydrogenotrophicum]